LPCRVGHDRQWASGIRRVADAQHRPLSVASQGSATNTLQALAKGGTSRRDSTWALNRYIDGRTVRRWQRPALSLTPPDEQVEQQPPRRRQHREADRRGSACLDVLGPWVARWFCFGATQIQEARLRRGGVCGWAHPGRRLKPPARRIRMQMARLTPVQFLHRQAGLENVSCLVEPLPGRLHHRRIGIGTPVHLDTPRAQAPDRVGWTGAVDQVTIPAGSLVVDMQGTKFSDA
jgi:hypothetical protein